MLSCLWMLLFGSLGVDIKPLDHARSRDNENTDDYYGFSFVQQQQHRITPQHSTLKIRGTLRRLLSDVHVHDQFRGSVVMRWVNL